MKNWSVFARIMFIIAIALFCLVLTVAVALLLGKVEFNIFDISELNLLNVLPAILIGGFVSCIVVGVLVIVLSKDIFIKVKKFLFESKEDKGEKR